MEVEGSVAVDYPFPVGLAMVKAFSGAWADTERKPADAACDTRFGLRLTPS